MIGQRINNLVVLREDGRDKRGKLFRVLCDCGKEVTYPGTKLRAGERKSCGCRQGKTAHGLHKHPIYTAWENMRQRTRNPKCPEFCNYGARGIKIAEAWEDFIEFFADMAPSWEPRKSLDRRKNQEDYSPSNCWWATDLQQSNNTRRNIFIETPAGRMTLAQAARHFCLSFSTLRYRIRQGWPVEKALSPSR